MCFIAGLAFSAFTGIASGYGLALIFSLIFFLCAFIPPFVSNFDEIRSSGIIRFLKSPEFFTPLTTIFLALALFSFGVFRYVVSLDDSNPNHLETICSKYDDSTRWLVQGKVIEEPNFKAGHLEVLVKPDKIARYETEESEDVEEGASKRSRRRRNFKSISEKLLESQPVDGGLILVTVYDDNPFFKELVFSQTVEIQGALSQATDKRNPGALDYKKYLRNRGIFRSIKITSRTGSIRILEEAKGGNPWYRFALYLKNEVLKVIKKTMPYPQSSFLGGVLLGLKGGLPPKIAQEFRMTGVSHVLAVSGLHVTIIAGLLYGIFAMLRVPVKFFAPVIVFFLFTFALIVGWPSSAVRAALMNSIFIIARAYFKDLDFKVSVVFALTIACDFILLSSPLQLTEPSFTLSAMAIYSLAVFSEPSKAILRRIMRGPGLYVSFFITVLFYLIIALNRNLVLYHSFYWLTLAYFFIGALLCYRLAGYSGFQSYCFENLPQWLQSFLSAQMAILLAMMAPLSAYYFGQFSLASPVANIVAIPLIGVIVQIGLIAGIVGAFVPLVGIYVAFILNAANWLLVNLFMSIATFFAFIIPYPRISQPNIYMLLLYYAVLHIIYFYSDIKNFIIDSWETITDLWEEQENRLPVMIGSAFVIGALAILIIIASSDIKTMPDLKLTVMDVGYGSSTLVQHDGKITVIDCGYADITTETESNDTVLLPALSSMRISEIDSVVLTSLVPERIAGFHALANSYKINKLYLPIDLPTNGKTIGFDSYARGFSFGDRKLTQQLEEETVKVPPCNYMEHAYKAYNQLIKDVKEYRIPVAIYEAGDTLKGTACDIKCLAPVKLKTPYQLLYDGAVLSISHNNKKYLYVSGNNIPLAEVTDFEPDYIIMADLPNNFKRFKTFIDITKTSGVIFSYRTPNRNLMDGYFMNSTLRNREESVLTSLKNIEVPFCITSESGAVEISQNKHSVTVHKYLNDKDIKK